MSLEQLGDMFEQYSADICVEKFPLMPMSLTYMGLWLQGGTSCDFIYQANHFLSTPTFKTRVVQGLDWGKNWRKKIILEIFKIPNFLAKICTFF